jgi:hypothetical protein
VQVSNVQSCQSRQASSLGSEQSEPVQPVHGSRCLDFARNLDRVNGYSPPELRVGLCRCAVAPARAGTGQCRAADGRSVRSYCTRAEGKDAGRAGRGRRKPGHKATFAWALLPPSILLGLSASAFAQSANSPVYPPGTSALGLTYGEWSATWWQWLLAIPSATNPENQPTGAVDCSINQAGSVWFLAGSASNKAVTLTCSNHIPSTASILFPLINVECSTQDLPPFHCTDAASCRKCSATTADGISPTSLHVTVDGNDVLNGAQGFRALSPFFNFTVPADNILGSGAGPGMSISDGYWVMLKPLSPGQHTIRFGGSFVRGPGTGFMVDTTYVVTVSQ